MKRMSLLITLVAAVIACQRPEPIVSAVQLGPDERLQLAGRGRERAAYSAYAIALFDLHLSFLETLPDGWFIGSAEFDDGTEELAAVTGIDRTYDGDLANLRDLGDDVEEWQTWYMLRREQLSPDQRSRLDPLYARLEGTTPLLISGAFRDVVNAAAAMSAIPASWTRSEGGELYADWATFAEDRRGWRDWFETHRDRLEWDELGHRLVIGIRGLGPPE